MCCEEVQDRKVAEARQSTGGAGHLKSILTDAGLAVGAATTAHTILSATSGSTTLLEPP